MKRISILTFWLFAVAVFNLKAQVPVAYYPFNNNLNDQSGNGHDGSGGGVLANDRYDQPNSAYLLNGSSDLIEITDHPNLDGMSQLSISIWIKPTIKLDASSSNQVFITKGLGWNIMYINGGVRFIAICETDNGDFTYPMDLDANRWYHLALVYDGSTAIGYIDGVQVGSDNGSGNIRLSSWDVIIGARYDQVADFFSGTVDDIRIYDDVLSSADIVDLNNNTIDSWVRSSENVILNGGRVGIGISSPNETLSVSSMLSVSGENGIAAKLIVESNDANNSIDFIARKNNLSINQPGRDIRWFTKNNQEQSMVLNDQGYLGVGIPIPSERLTVKNDFSISGSIDKAKLIISANDSDNAIDIIARKSNMVTAQPGRSVRWYTKYNEDLSMVLTSEGELGIGTATPKSKLAVNGEIRATEVKVLAKINVPDYVFEPDYELRTLRETKEYIKENKHLPEIPSAAEIGENGIDLGDMNMKLLKKIEELTLHQIELLEKVEELQSEVEKLENK